MMVSLVLTLCVYKKEGLAGPSSIIITLQKYK